MEFVLDLPPPPFYTLYGPRDGSTSAATAVAPVPHDEGAQAGGAAGSGEGSAAAIAVGLFPEPFGRVSEMTNEEAEKLKQGTVDN